MFSKQRSYMEDGRRSLFKIHDHTYVKSIQQNLFPLHLTVCMQHCMLPDRKKKNRRLVVFSEGNSDTRNSSHRQKLPRRHRAHLLEVQRKLGRDDGFYLQDNSLPSSKQANMNSLLPVPFFWLIALSPVSDWRLSPIYLLTLGPTTEIRPRRDGLSINYWCLVDIPLSLLDMPLEPNRAFGVCSSKFMLDTEDLEWLV